MDADHTSMSWDKRVITVFNVIWRMNSINHLQLVMFSRRCIPIRRMAALWTSRRRKFLRLMSRREASSCNLRWTVTPIYQMVPLRLYSSLQSKRTRFSFRS